MNLITKHASDFGKENVETRAFPDGDAYIRILEDIESEDKGNRVNIFTRLYPEQNRRIVETILIASAIKDAGFKNIHLYAPYLPYSRQDKIWKKGEALSAKYIVNTLKDAGINTIHTVDCHFIKKEGVFKYWGMNIVNKTAAKRLIEEAKKDVSDLLIMSPDEGASYMSEEHGGKHMKKVRGEYVEGETAYRKIDTLEIKGNVDVKDRDVLLIDDIIGGGSTMIKAISKLKESGAKHIYIGATHGFFLGNSLEKLKQKADKIITTTSIKNETSVIDVFNILTEE